MPRLAYGIPEGAEALGVSARKLRDIIAHGEIKVRRVGTRVLIPVAEIERFLSDGTSSWTPANTGRHATTAGGKVGVEA